ncbi:hypothetical protein [Cuneatibacter caecimuris]|nr:hypothetical protein [Cuneatibacter caecimuris]
MKKTKKRGSYITKQERDAEWGKPLFSAVVQGKVKEIFRSSCYVFPNIKAINYDIVAIVLSVGEIIFFSLVNKDHWIHWLAFSLAVILLALIFKKTIYPLLVILYYCHVICKSRKIIELGFYMDSLSVYFGVNEVWNFPYEDLDEVSVIPKETWLIFKKRKAVLLPERSITPDQQKSILNYLQEKRPELKILHEKIVK